MPLLKKSQGRDENEVSEGTYLCEKANLEQAWKAYDGAIRLDHLGTAEAREKETAQLSQASELFREAGANFDAAQVLYEEAKVYLGLHDANNALECSGRAIELAEGFKSEEAEARVRMLEGAGLFSGGIYPVDNRSTASRSTLLLESVEHIVSARGKGTSIGKHWHHL